MFPSFTSRRNSISELEKKPRKVKGHCEMEFAGKECFVNICVDLKAASQVRNS